MLRGVVLASLQESMMELEPSAPLECMRGEVVWQATGKKLGQGQNGKVIEASKMWDGDRS